MKTEVQLAQWLGCHATTVFFIFLGVLLASVWVAWLLFPRFERGWAHHLLPDHSPLTWRLIIGFAIILAAGVLFAEMTEALEAQATLGRFDVALTQALPLQLSTFTLQCFAIITHLGDRGTLTVLCLVTAAALLALGHRTLALGWVLAVAGNGLLKTLLKRVFERARPMHTHGLLVSDHGWSFPSAHSSGSVVAYGMLAYLALRLAPRRWRLPALLLGCGLAFTTGASRIFLQVHYASDVLAGFASGLLWLTVCILSLEWWRWRSI